MKKLNLIFGLLLLAAVGCSLKVVSEGPKERVLSNSLTPDSRQQLNHINLELKDLSAIMNAVLLTIDAEPGSCEINPDVRPQLSQQLKALVDERFFFEKENYSRGHRAQKAAFFPQNCAAECTCSLYLSFLDFLKEKRFSIGPTEEKARRALQAQLQVEVAQRKSCFQDQKWVCQSQVFKSIAAE